MLIVVLLLTIPVAILAMRLAEKVMKKSLRRLTCSRNNRRDRVKI